jgi:cysteine desulfurase
MKEIYLDNNATTRPLPAVVEAMQQACHEAYGNPSSLHAGGQRARKLLDEARESVSRLCGAYPEQVIFTSSGTEANNLVLHSAIVGIGAPRIVTSSIEHSSILRHCEFLESQGAEVIYLPVGKDGLVDVSELREALKRPTTLVSIQWVNNETGVVQPMETIAALCKAASVPLHSDAAQAIGKLPLDFADWSGDFLTGTGHKFHGPAGTGFVVAAKASALVPLLHGGGQEGGKRAGTENLVGIHATGVAAQLRSAEMAAIVLQIASLRDAFEQELARLGVKYERNGEGAPRVCSTNNLMFPGVDGEALVPRLDQVGVFCSHSSACTNMIPEPSYVLTAMGLDADAAYASVRFGFSIDNTMEEAIEAAKRVAEVVDSLVEE